MTAFFRSRKIIPDQGAGTARIAPFKTERPDMTDPQAALTPFDDDIDDLILDDEDDTSCDDVGDPAPSQFDTHLLEAIATDSRIKPDTRIKLCLVKIGAAAPTYQLEFPDEGDDEIRWPVFDAIEARAIAILMARAPFTQEVLNAEVPGDSIIELAAVDMPTISEHERLALVTELHKSLIEVLGAQKAEALLRITQGA